MTFPLATKNPQKNTDFPNKNDIKITFFDASIK